MIQTIKQEDNSTMRIAACECTLGEGGSTKGGGWIRLEEAGSAKQGMYSM
jgi:hypothetical protein